MKTFMRFLAISGIPLFISCGELTCGYYEGNQLFQGAEDSCYFTNSIGIQTYVDREECDC